ncbi:MAG: hypothetical protein LBI43_01915 [Streptococcaceae bacterium]|nr:hypothetical protein [Streptococcaceae bacterium]
MTWAPAGSQADNVASLESQLQAAQVKLATLQNEQSSLSDSLKKLSAAISKDQNGMAEQMRSMQVSGTSTSMVESILSATSISEAMEKMFAANQILTSEQNLLESYNRQKESYNTQLAQYQKNYEAANSLVTKLKKEEAAAKAAQQTALAASYQSILASLPASGTLNLNQVHGYVNIADLANYMQSITGGDAATWAMIIERESGGNLDAYNPSGAVGPFQSLGHGDTLGQTLGSYCASAARIYYSQGFYGAWLRWE